MGSSLVLCLAISMLLGSISTPNPVLAQGVATKSPVGRWKTVDDATGKVKSVVTIWEEAGKLYGRIQKLVDPDPHDALRVRANKKGARSSGSGSSGICRRTATPGPEERSSTLRAARCTNVYSP
jgi:hypothetical protein